MRQSELTFGGDWTVEKLRLLQEYLKAYTKALRKQPFQLAYIDAFAGTGEWRPKGDEKQPELLFPELMDEDWAGVRKGSVRIALETQPLFDKYFFVEKDPKCCAQLRRVVAEDFPGLQERTEIVAGDANLWLKTKCETWDRNRWRAVVLLDPCGMEVEWKTVEAVADTRCMDMWYLFPLGVGVNRLLQRDGQISPGRRKKLDSILGGTDWQEVFYRLVTEEGLFGRETTTIKDGGFDRIRQFFVARLEKVFAGVAQNPRLLYNSVGNPIYLFCFAVGNPRGKGLALRIAEYILKG